MAEENAVSGKDEEIKEKASEKVDDRIIEERKKKLISFVKKTNLWVLGLLILALILGIYIRSQPMLDHGGKPGLWDITTNTWTLGPDLDPWLFLRYAKTIVEQGSLPKIDTLRNVPLGFDTSIETQVLPYMIAGTYSLLNIFLKANVELAGVLFPVIMFALTILSFFLFVREIFIRKDKESITKANIISIISTFFMIVVPTFLSRTVAGIPEKESAAFFFMFLAFYLFLKAWKSDSLRNAIILGVLSGSMTALMALIWGGVGYIFMTIVVASLLAFILNKMHKKEIIVFFLWIFFSILIIQLFSNRFVLKTQLTSIDTGLAVFLLFTAAIHYIIWRKGFAKSSLEKIKLPKNIISLLVAVVLGIIIICVLLGPGFILEKLQGLYQTFIRPITGRWSVTVAENRQPYFTEWGASFGPFIKNIPVLFWLFFIGSVLLFKNMLNDIKKKDSWILTGTYVLFFFGLVFSRYSESSTFNGENFISILFYFGSALLLIGTLIYYYLRYDKEGQEGFEKLEYEYLLLFSLFFICLFTARSAVRLIMVLAPIAPIFLGCLIVDSASRFKKAKDSTGRIVLGIAIILILILSLFTFWNYYNSVKSQAYSFIPSYYNQQWQKAMQWVRDYTPKEAVFAHWWDYGYWVQSIGNRATVTDGGNAIPYWNYLTGRLVLTGDNEKDALEFLYNHNATHLLIDSSDIGKYTAFSSIGSDLNYDRYSWVPVMLSDEKQVLETRNGTSRVYQGASGTDEDIVYEEDGKEIYLPGQKSAIIGITLEVYNNGETSSLKQPQAVFYYQGVQHRIPLRYAYFNKQLLDFKTGLNATAYILQRVYQADQGLKLDNFGALMYLSPRMMRGLFAQKYLLDDPFKRFTNFKLVHSETNLIIESLNSQGMNLNEFIFYQDVQGPIKIWEIKYTGNEKIRQDYLDTDASKYISWSL